MKDGGSAFPVLDSCAFEGGGSRLDCVDRGMTLRDYFAGQALAGYIVTGPECMYPTPEDAAKYSYKIADAMLAERERE